MIDLHAVAEEILERADVGFSRLSVLQMNRSTATEISLGLLVFIDNGDAPAAMVKLTPSAEKATALRQEHANLARLQAGGSAEFARTVPAPLFFGEVSGYTALAQSALPGTRMKNLPPESYFPSPRFERHLAMIVDWLGDFHAAAGVAADAPPALEALLDDPLGLFREAYRRSPAVDELLAAAAAHLRGGPPRLAPWHGDFCTANLLVTPEDGIGVIDWEYPLEPTWPLGDLLYFIASIRCVDRGGGRLDHRENFRRLFFEDGRFAEPIRGGVARFAARAGLAEADLLPLSAMAWVLYANQKQAYLRDHGQTLADEKACARHLPLLMVEDGHCVNLEMLAEEADRYVLRGAGAAPTPAPPPDHA